MLLTPFLTPAQTAGDFIKNGDFKEGSAEGGAPAYYQLAGNVVYGYLADPAKEFSYWGVALRGFGTGSVSQTVDGVDFKAGRQFRFTFRGLPQDNFFVTDDDLYMKVEFFGDGGRTSFDGKVKTIYPEVEQARRDMTVNGVRHTGGAAVWRTYGLDFALPFPQVTEVRVSVGFGHGASRGAALTNFLVTGFSLVQIPGQSATAATSETFRPQGVPIPLGGRWFYDAKPGETAAPGAFDESNAGRLLYKAGTWSAPFEGNMTAWLRAGEKDLNGNIVTEDRFIPDNVTVRFDATSMIVHTHSIPNHPTGKFPEQGFGRGFNPNYIQEQENTYYIPLNPAENPDHFATTLDNSNHALPMGPIGIAVNGVVFFNPFDMGNADATDLMDRCCGHPNPDNLYHYHKYPICVNSPWSDEGTTPSPVIGWAFDGFPIYGPYESAGVMAKDLQGANSLNAFNMHFDSDRGWHYHVTPGKFPYIIGGYWGTEDPRDRQRPRHPPGSAFSGGGPPRGGPQGPFPPFPPGPPP